MTKVPRIILIGLCLISSPSVADELELEQAKQLSKPYCIDMRILSERKRAPTRTSTKALTKLFDCKKTYVLPLSVRADDAMIARYRKKLERFRGHTVLAWCTHGVRTGRMQDELNKVGYNISTIKGGTLFLADVIDLK